MPDVATQTIPHESSCFLHNFQSDSPPHRSSIGTQTESNDDLTITVVDDSRCPSGSLVLRSRVEIQYDTVSEESISTTSIVFDSDMDSGYDSDRDPLRQRRNILGRLLNIDDYYDYLLDG